jgi:hypothetical protein
LLPRFLEPVQCWRSCFLLCRCWEGLARPRVTCRPMPPLASVTTAVIPVRPGMAASDHARVISVLSAVWRR